MNNPFQLDFHTLIEKADKIRQEKWSKKVFFVRNLHLNYTNICVSHCKFCAFSKNKNEDGSYNMSKDDAVKYVAEKGKDAREVHIVGGLHPDYPFEYYKDMVHALKTNFPEKVIKSFSAVEIDYFTRISRKSVSQVLKELKEAGVEMLPGGGAVPRHVRPHLHLRRRAHRPGQPGNAHLLRRHLDVWLSAVLPVPVHGSGPGQDQPVPGAAAKGDPAGSSGYSAAHGNRQCNQHFCGRAHRRYCGQRHFSAAVLPQLQAAAAGNRTGKTDGRCPGRQKEIIRRAFPLLPRKNAGLFIWKDRRFFVPAGAFT